jgi:hypothetical protein
LEDDGRVYDNFHAKQPRSSSHYAGQRHRFPTFYIEGKFNALNRVIYLHLLIGKMKGDDGRAHTWFQAERSPWRAGGNLAEQALYAAGNLHSAILHGKDYLTHKMTGRQVGPLGTSAHHEKMPVSVECFAEQRGKVKRD